MTAESLGLLYSDVMTTFGLRGWCVRAFAAGTDSESHERYITVTLLRPGDSDLRRAVDVTLYTTGDYLIGRHHEYGE